MVLGKVDVREEMDVAVVQEVACQCTKQLGHIPASGGHQLQSGGGEELASSSSLCRVDDVY